MVCYSRDECSSDSEQEERCSTYGDETKGVGSIEPYLSSQWWFLDGSEKKKTWQEQVMAR